MEGNLPAGVTSFVGRKTDLAETKKLLGIARLVTLTGLGGVGKSRLALRVAHAVRRAFPGGVYVVDLARVGNPGLLAHAVADVMRLPDQTVRPQLDVLAAHLADRRVLLVLDGAEHLLDDVAELAEVLLRRAPRLRVLVTSRQALDVEGEHLLVIGPMGPSDGLSLLLERSEAAGAPISDREVAARICARLDGIPLAMELAAVRLRTLTLGELLRRLDDRFLALDGDPSAPGRTARQRTLRATMGWSHELCTPAERLLWARLSVFAGGFGLTAVEQVCSDMRLPRRDVLDVITGLVDKSIVIREQGADGARYRMLDTVREYGAEWLDRLGVEERLRLRRLHRDHYLHKARQSEEAWFGPQQESICAATREDRANYRLALEFSTQTPGEQTAAQELAATLWFYWVGCGHLAEGRHWLELSLTIEPTPSPARSRALWTAAYVGILQGDAKSSIDHLEEAREHGEGRDRACAIHRLGCAALLEDDHERAIPLFREALGHYDRLGLVDSHVLMARIELAMALAFRGECEASAALCEHVRATCESRGERWVLSYAHYVAAYGIWQAGDAAEALRLARECARINHVFHDLVGVVLAIELVALVLTGNGDFGRAAELQGAAGRIWESVGPPLFGSVYFNAPHIECERRARLALGDQGYEEAAARGAQMALDEAVAVALGARPSHARASVLTRREIQVAELISRGMSNREVAELLVVSKRTVDAHVEHILAKLGFSSRAQVAAWISETRGAEPRESEKNGG
ncbi:LuxR family transcriptional regulator [Streptosporangiaceae bacterium NEAU-GS5]|nr:LuxR family transcriptional regulator [Streptosporangiaceae bacterium NEAU-GS5]